jgi:AcrR family transcriptional regulator
MPRTEEANQRIREERKEHILSIAVQIFAQKGLAGTRVADIATAGEMSQGLIFRYFASKEEVFAAVVERALQGAADLAQAAFQQPLSPLGKLRWLVQCSLAELWSRPEYSLVIHEALNGGDVPQEVRERAIEQGKRSLHLYQQLIVEGQQAGEVVQGNAATLTLVFVACMQGLATEMLHVPSLLGIYEPPDPDVILRLLKA